MALNYVSLKKNIFISYLSQAYVVLLGIVILPFYITTLGAEAYGLIGFFSMLQAMFTLLDLGLTPTISRETARFHAGALSRKLFAQLYATINLIFISIASLGGGVIYFFSDVISSKWLNVGSLSAGQVSFAIKTMALCIAMRWMTGLYRGVVVGSELLVWIGYFNILIATMRFIFIFPVLWMFGSNISVFFTYQLIVAITEFLLLRRKANLYIPKLDNENCISTRWSFSAIKPYVNFSLSIAITSGLWVVVTQTDKLMMSKLLSLEDYGYFTLAVLVANGIMMLASPVSNAIMPRMARLEAEGNRQEVVKVYRNSTRIISVLAGCSGIIFIFFSKEILFVWTGDSKIVEASSYILQLYSAGYAILCIAAFPYYLQYAIGNLKLHLIGSFIFVSILLPLLWYCTRNHGMAGAGTAWLVTNIFYFLFWTSIVHKKFLPKLHFSWLLNDVIKILILPLVFILACSYFFIESSRLVMFFELVFISLFSFILSACSTSEFRVKVKNKIVGFNAK